MKSFFLKVSLLAGLSLSGFCSVFAQTKTEVINTYLKVTSEEDFVEDGVYVVVAPLKEDSTIMAVMAQVNEKVTHRYHVNIPDDVSDNILNIPFEKVATKGNQQGAYEFYLRKNGTKGFYLFDSVNELYLIAQNPKGSVANLGLNSLYHSGDKIKCTININDWIIIKLNFFLVEKQVTTDI